MNADFAMKVWYQNARKVVDIFYYMFVVNGKMN